MLAHDGVDALKPGKETYIIGRPGPLARAPAGVRQLIYCYGGADTRARALL